MPKFHIWTIGCQMNKAESERIAGYLKEFGYQPTQDQRDADIVVLNTCVVRQHAEDKVTGNLGYLKGIKKAKPNLSILVTGCFVNSKVEELGKLFPHVDFFFKPGAYSDFISWAKEKGLTTKSFEPTIPLPAEPAPTVFVPIIQGCNNFCSYCIVPYRRGREKSRPLAEIIWEIKELIKRGVKEVTLLGQNVNSYGHDLPGQPTLSDLLKELNQMEGLIRIRFLTNHPKDMSLELIKTIASLDKVCKHISLPLQSGDDEILKNMRRGYTADQYYQLIRMIRTFIPQVALSTDVIVGFPGETEEQFNRTLTLLKEIKFDAVHVAMYSPRPGTIASRKFSDSVPIAVKKERLYQVEALQTAIATEINSKFLGKTEEVLIEGKQRGKWFGRTQSNKLVFVEGDGPYLGQLIKVKINKTSPWALQGNLAE